MLRDPDGKELKAEWKPVKPGVVEVKLPLQDAQPGTMSLMIDQYGLAKPHLIPLRVFSNAARLDGFTLHAGDAQGVLSGSHLDEAASQTIGGLVFQPGELTTQGGTDQLTMVPADTQAAAMLKPDSSAGAKATLKGGRVVSLKASIDPPRPSVSLIGKSVRLATAGPANNIQLGDADELPQDARLTFSMRAQTPARFTMQPQIEVANADETLSTTPPIGTGIKMSNSTVELAQLEPAKAFGFSAFGPHHSR